MGMERATQTLRSVNDKISLDSPDAFCRDAAKIIHAQDAVRSRYRPLFSPEMVNDLQADEFRGFLLFDNNQHWSGIHRQSGWMTADMPRLREALALLVDEELSLKTRLNRLRPKSGDPMIKGLARSVITAVLHIVYPKKYGVLNNTAKEGMKQVGVWPEFSWGASFADRYEAVNRVLLDLAQELRIDLWTLDALWWRLTLKGSPRFDGAAAGTSQEQSQTGEPVESPHRDSGGSFALERHLHEFLVDNWPRTDLAGEWELLEEDGEIVGSHYATREIGEIDLLARHRKDNRWLVIELKRNQSSDNTVGQTLRYMGWVRRNLAAEGGTVEGLIICGEIDRKLQYALDGQRSIRCMTYQVSFNLSPVPDLSA